MDKKKITDFLKRSNLRGIEELKHDDSVLVLRFYYDFDKTELDAAKSYANDDSEDEAEGDIWYEEFFKPYLNDLAVDNVGEIIEELIDKEEVQVQYVSYDIDDENYEYNEFIAIFYNNDTDVNIEDILDELGL